MCEKSENKKSPGTPETRPKPPPRPGIRIIKSGSKLNPPPNEEYNRTLKEEYDDTRD